MIFTDQLGQEVRLEGPPQRIVSLVPSITELLCDLDIGERLVGCTKFCVHPASIRSQTTVIGGTKNPRLSAIEELHPDLIIANKEENRESDVSALRLHTPVWVSDVKTVEDSTHLIKSLGAILDAQAKATQLSIDIQDIIKGSHVLLGSAAYLIWKDPYMTIGHDTYIHHMLEMVGLKNVFDDARRYPTVTLDEIISLQPDFIFLSSEPYPYKENHVEEISNSIPQSNVILVDGEFFSWYGTRLLKKSDYPQELKRTMGL